MLREELDVPRKQRHTARRVCARLSDEHGAKELPYSTVRDYARLREARDLFTSMNQRILAAAAPDAAGDAGIDAWTQLGEVSVPVLCTWGEFDLHCDIPFYK